MEKEVRKRNQSLLSFVWASRCLGEYTRRAGSADEQQSMRSRDRRRGGKTKSPHETSSSLRRSECSALASSEHTVLQPLHCASCSPQAARPRLFQSENPLARQRCWFPCGMAESDRVEGSVVKLAEWR